MKHHEACMAHIPKQGTIPLWCFVHFAQQHWKNDQDLPILLQSLLPIFLQLTLALCWMAWIQSCQHNFPRRPSSRALLVAWPKCCMKIHLRHCKNGFFTSGLNLCWFHPMFPLMCMEVHASRGTLLDWKKVGSCMSLSETLHGNKSDQPNVTVVAQEAKLSPGFVSKIAEELDVHSKIMLPTAKNSWNHPTSVGLASLSLEDQSALLGLLEHNPFHTHCSYCWWLQEITGTVVLQSRMSGFFRSQTSFPETCSNLRLWHDILNALIWFGGLIPSVSSLVTSKCWRAWRCTVEIDAKHVSMGETPEFLVDGDFQNTHSIIRFCGINKKAPPLSFSIHDKKSNSWNFSQVIAQAVSEVFYMKTCLQLMMQQCTAKERIQNLWNGRGKSMVLLWSFHQLILQSWIQMNWCGAVWWWNFDQCKCPQNCMPLLMPLLTFLQMWATTA